MGELQWNTFIFQNTIFTQILSKFGYEYIVLLVADVQIL